MSGEMRRTNFLYALRNAGLNVIVIGVALMTFAAVSYAQVIQDVTFATKYQSGKPTTAHFYYNDQAIGSGREAFAKIVESIEKLPEGTSVVWGPNYQRCGSCSGREPDCVPKFLYPDLWSKLEQHIKSRKLVISSSFPGPNNYQYRQKQTHVIVPLAVSLKARSAEEKHDVILDWTMNRKESYPADMRRFDSNQFQPLSSENQDLKSAYALECFLDGIPVSAKILIRVKASLNPNDKIMASDLPHQLKYFRDFWRSEIAGRAFRKKWEITVAVEDKLLEDFRAYDWNPPDPLTISWDNFHGQDTPHKEVAYSINDEFVGLGDHGFDQILSRLKELPQGATFRMPSYTLSGRRATESLSLEQLKAFNKNLAMLVPYANRRRQLADVVAKRKLVAEHFEISTSLAPNSTVHDWSNTDSLGLFVTHGRIVRHDEPRETRAAKLEWTNFDAHLRSNRPQESEAMYVLDKKEVGQGVAGFAKAMDHLATLPPGSIVQVQVCLRTKAPFICPIIYEGQRHFERTGDEPFCGMVQWLVSIAQAKQLQIEWLPDEQKTFGNCELNK